MPLRHPPRLLRLHLIINRDIQVSSVIHIRPTAELPTDTLTGFGSKYVGEIEDGLLPVRVLGMRARAKPYRLMTGGKLDVEPGYQGVDVVGAPAGEVEGQAEGEVGWGAGVEVEGDDGAGVCDDSFEIDGVDEGFGEGGEF